MRVSIRALVRESLRVLQEGGWITDDYYEDEASARQRELVPACSVGAMRLAFRRIFVVDPNINDEALINHPAYAEGMRFLGQAVYAAERERGNAERGLVKLLNGDEINPDTGSPYKTEDVESSVIEWNDGTVLNYAGQDPEELVLTAFEDAILRAPESEQDWPEVRALAPEPSF